MSEAAPSIAFPCPAKVSDANAIDLLVRMHAWLFAPDQVVELRALKVANGNYRPYTEAGYFDGEHRRELAAAAWDLSKKAGGVYCTLNPLLPAVLARKVNRTDRADDGNLTKDHEVLTRRLLLVDVDPVRPSGISATDAEKSAACEVIRSIRATLRERGWPEPVLADSGNGFHLFYRIDLPVKDDNLVQKVLETLAKKFDTDQAKVDKTVHNPSRIVKLPGTRACKGDATTDRPHRRARLLEVPAHGQPAEVQVVSREQLEALIVAFTPPDPFGLSGEETKTSKSTYSRLLIEQWLADRRVDFRKKPEPDKFGRTVYVLKTCPFNADHGDPDSCIMQKDDGELSAKCFHDSCTGKGWQDFKAKIGKPDGKHYDPPLIKVTIKGGKKRKPKTTPPPPDSDPPTDPTNPPPSGTELVPLASKPTRVIGGSTRGVVTICEEMKPVDDVMQSIWKLLYETNEYYVRAGQIVRIRQESIQPLLKPVELIGAVNSLGEVQIVDMEEETSKYKPLPDNYAKTFIHRPDIFDKFPLITLYTRNPVYTTDWRLAPSGYDPESGIYNAGPAITPREGTARIDALLQDFCFVSPGDRTNYLAFLLTILLMPRFIGAKPAVLFHGNQPGLGKTILAQILSVIRDGRSTETVTYNPNDEEFEKRLGAVVRNGTTTIIIDNAKARGGRNPRIESACLERSITDEMLSFRLLGHSATIRAENSHLFCLSANTPELSKDLVSRSVAVRLRYEGDPAKRTFTIDDPVEYAREYRVEILGELAGMVERWLAAGKPESKVANRFKTRGWGRIIGGILDVNGLPDFLGNAEVIAEEVDEIRREFAILVTLMADKPQGWMTPAQLVELAVRERLFESELQDRAPRSQATRLGILAGRFIEERFTIADGRIITFHKTEDRKGMKYSVSVLVTDEEESQN
jgi:hypothetical protein